MAEIETSEVNVDAILDPQDIRVSIEDVIVIKGQDADIAAAEAATSAANEAATLANDAADNANETANTIKQRADAGEFNGKDGEPGVDGSNGKSAYQYAQDGGYTGTETEFAKKLSSDVLVVKVGQSDGVWSADKTYSEIVDAVMSGTSVFVRVANKFLPFTDCYDNSTDNSYVAFVSMSVVNDGKEIAIYTIGYLIFKDGHVMSVASYIPIPTDDHINALINAKLETSTPK